MTRAKKTPSQDLAKLFVKNLDGLKYVFCPLQKKFDSGIMDGWYRYSEQSGWVLIDDSVVQRAVNTFLVECIRSSEDLTKQRLNDVFNWVRTYLMVSFPEKKSPLDPTLWIRFEDCEIHAESASGWIACNNALIDVKAVACALYKKEPIPEDAIKPLNPELFTLGRVPCNFEPGAECPRWLQFVKEVCPQNVDRRNLQRAFGLSLTYDRRFNVSFVVYGDGGTGKSTGLSMMETLNSGLVCAVSLSKFGERFDIYPLTKNRLNLVADLPAVWESSATAEEREAVLKSLTCGEFVQVERKGIQGDTMRLRALCVFGSNQVPRFLDKTRAIRDRIRLIPFPVKFRNEAVQDTGLGQKLLQELPGIFLWSLVGYGELKVEHYQTIPESEEAESLKHEAELQANPILAFCEDCLEACPGLEFPTNTAYQAYRVYCERNGLKPIGSRLVIPEIGQVMGVDKTKNKKRRSVFVGIQFNPEWEKFFPDSDSCSSVE